MNAICHRMTTLKQPTNLDPRIMSWKEPATHCKTLQCIATHESQMANGSLLTNRDKLMVTNHIATGPRETVDFYVCALALWCTATHCNTLQHIATHCNTHITNGPQFTTRSSWLSEPHCNRAQRKSGFQCARTSPVLYCNTLQHTATHCSTLQRNTLQQTATHCSTLQHTNHKWPTTQHPVIVSNNIATGPSDRVGFNVCVLALRSMITHCNTLQHIATGPWGFNGKPEGRDGVTPPLDRIGVWGVMTHPYKTWLIRHRIAVCTLLFL